MSHNVIIISWPEEAKAYQALSELRSSSSNGINQAAVVQRSEDGKIVVRDGSSKTDGLGTLTGSALGSLIGILGGPVGVLLGFSTGALFGSIADFGSVIDDQAVLAGISSAIKPGSTTLIVDINETNPKLVDALVAGSGGKLIRRSYDEVYDEITSAAAAAEAAVAAASKAIREEKRAERKADREKKWEETKAKFKALLPAA